VTQNTSHLCDCYNACADLLSKLSGERSRWAQQLAALDGQLAELPRAALAAAAFITYLPAHPEDVRERVMQGWTRCGPRLVVDIVDVLSTWQLREEALAGVKHLL
jgi:dynein heavy chain 2